MELCTGGPEEQAAGKSEVVGGGFWYDQFCRWGSGSSLDLYVSCRLVVNPEGDREPVQPGHGCCGI